MFAAHDVFPFPLVTCEKVGSHQDHGRVLKVELKSAKVLPVGNESSTFLGLKLLGFTVLSNNY